MYKVNEYYNGRVKSISLQSPEGPMTIGVMAEGEYEFNTSSQEYMTVTSGEMKVLLPDSKEWQIFKEFETFIVDKNSSFKVVVEKDTTYRCLYK